ncbi:MAG: hypothetical protein WCX29_02980 [Candidatus Peribacteraceae bacterium]
MNRYDIAPANGYFGSYGGQYIPDHVKPIFHEIDATYQKLKDSPVFCE